jgi:hypothetical protein
MDAKTYCWDCCEPEQVAGMAVLKVDRGDVTAHGGVYYKVVAYCDHKKTAFLPLGIQNSRLEIACRDARVLRKELFPKVKFTGKDIYEILESALPDPEPPVEWKRKHLKPNGNAEVPKFKVGSKLDDEGFLV